ncbi:uncharacterized protein cubi_00755 [Cryptosporidium ubiquitum]|uniref:Uncharacterized protein n=1 Tax=Cryptosporidium ubiquitum TaxID=857276 RepID=A0A1J4MAX4_9CRYT|nr:uncharacterized protein cubi_00755 [Cryptosporidium ubiquitum]OII71377.1 hypothetical protein cubi_00755 [Cryptosporidium ubiquitum]
MEFFDDDTISNMNRMDLKNKPNIFDDLLEEDEEVEQVNEEDVIFLGDEKNRNGLLFRSNYDTERIKFENENKAEKIIFGIEERREEELEKREDEVKVEVEIAEREKLNSNPFGMVERLDFQEFNDNLNDNEFDNDFGIDNKFEDNEDVFSFSRFNRNVNEEKGVYSRQIEHVKNIETEENDISNNLFELNQKKQDEKGRNSNIEKEKFNSENLALDNHKITSQSIQDDSKLNEIKASSNYSDTYTNINKENKSTSLEKIESEKIEKNILSHHLSGNSKETNIYSSANSGNETCGIPNNVTKSNCLQSSIEDIDWNKVCKIIESFEEQTGNIGRNQMLFKSIIYKLANEFNIVDK